MRKDQTSKKSKEKVSENIWLLYFNDILLKNGVITETNHNRMIAMINERFES